jgi:hypothetical protein
VWYNLFRVRKGSSTTTEAPPTGGSFQQEEKMKTETKQADGLNIKWACTKEEHKLIALIVTKAKGDMCMMMDLEATHSNGCPLDFQKLLAADKFNFWHDINGIQRHIDRGNGKLLDYFLPRCAKAEKNSLAQKHFEAFQDAIKPAQKRHETAVLASRKLEGKAERKALDAAHKAYEKETAPIRKQYQITEAQG